MVFAVAVWTSRGVPAAIAASTTARMAPTVTAEIAGVTLLLVETYAAQWNTTSAPANTPRSSATEPRSAQTQVTGRSARDPVSVLARRVAVTVCPCAISSAVRLAPSRPLAPATTACAIWLFPSKDRVDAA